MNIKYFITVAARPRHLFCDNVMYVMYVGTARVVVCRSSPCLDNTRFTHSKHAPLCISSHYLLRCSIGKKQLLCYCNSRLPSIICNVQITFVSSDTIEYWLTSRQLDYLIKKVIHLKILFLKKYLKNSELE